MKKIRTKNMLVSTVLVMILAFVIFGVNAKDNAIIEFISMITAIGGVILVVLQLYDSKKIQQAEFLVNLNQAFVSSEAYAKVYTELEKAANGEKEIQLSRIEISNYLTFFETVYILLEEKVVNIRILDDLFSYRFFLAAHSKFVQECKLVKEPNNFRNIYHLEAEWMEYRKAKNCRIYNEEDCLEKACERAGKKEVYNTIMQCTL